MKIKIFLLATALTATVFGHAGILKVEGEDHASTGIYIYDLRGDSVVVAEDIDRALAPASVMKALTSASVMLSQPRSFRFTTRVSATGKRDSLDNSVFRGDLVIHASSDPTLESAYFPAVAGFCDSIVANIQRKGISRIEGEIRVDADMPDQGALPRWEVDDLGFAYGAGLFAFNFRDNTFRLWPASGRTKPHVPDLRLTVRTGSSDIFRGVYSNHIVVYGPKPKDEKWAVTTTMPDPSAVMVYELKQKLEDSGVKIIVPKTEYRSPNTETIYIHRSPQLDDILQSLMFRSDNMMAEGMLRTLAPGKSRQAAIDREKHIWKERGLATQYTTIRDGSGLARADRVSAHFIGDMLRYMARSEYAARYARLFPLAGESGTLKNFMAKSRFKGRLALKTGSMNGVQCYGGYLLDADGKPSHVVVLLANSFFCSRGELREAFAKLLEEKL